MNKLNVRFKILSHLNGCMRHIKAKRTIRLFYQPKVELNYFSYYTDITDISFVLLCILLFYDCTSYLASNNVHRNRH